MFTPIKELMGQIGRQVFILSYAVILAFIQGTETPGFSWAAIKHGLT